MTYALPFGDLTIAPDPGIVTVPACREGDDRGLRDDKCARNTGPLSVVLRHQRGWDMLPCGSKTRKRRHHGAMLQIHVSDFERCEEFRCRHGARETVKMVGERVKVGGIDCDENSCEPVSSYTTLCAAVSL